MLPYYRKDMAAGTLTQQAAQELLECFWIKPNEMILLDDREHATYRGGYPNGWNLVVGGMTPEGTDGTNELSYMCLQAFEDVRLFQPNFGVRTFGGSPERFLARAWEVIALGAGVPQVFNDEVVIDALVRSGLPLEEARDYTPTGCVEHATPKAWIRGNGGWVNLAKAVEFALHNGRCALTGAQVGPRTGEIEEFTTYEAFETAVKQQLAYEIEQMVVENNLVDRIHAELVPELLISLLIHDCVANGKSAAGGGARLQLHQPHVHRRGDHGRLPRPPYESWCMTSGASAWQTCERPWRPISRGVSRCVRCWSTGRPSSATTTITSTASWWRSSASSPRK